MSVDEIDNWLHFFSSQNVFPLTARGGQMSCHVLNQGILFYFTGRSCDRSYTSQEEDKKCGNLLKGVCLVLSLESFYKPTQRVSEGKVNIELLLL